MASESDAVEMALHGWGRYPVARSYVRRPEKLAALERAATASTAPVIARGEGRSYGDAAQLEGGNAILTQRLNRLLAFDAETGWLHCEGGVTLRELIQVFLPRGWFPPVSPGTQHVTVGGAIAADVHGKNHHQDGSFGHFVGSLTVLVASGERVLCSREDNADLFWATVGGMGLTGIIVEAQLQLRRVASAYLRQYQVAARNLDEALALFDELEPAYRYSVAWIDCLASGHQLGRSLLMFGNHATPDELPAKARAAPLAVAPPGRWRVPFDLPAGLLNRYTVGAFNALYYARGRRQPAERIGGYRPFFYPLDFLQDWNHLYGQRGFVQYQCVLPAESSRAGLSQILSACARQGWGSFLAVLKRFGDWPSGWLSFPMPGYTLALDFPIKPGLQAFLAQLDAIVIRSGGRVYLAKDARLSAEAFRQMYPQHPHWQAVKARYDPANRFQSSLSQRLRLHEP